MGEIIINPADPVEPVTPMQEINRVYEVCKFGMFHVKVLCCSFFGCITVNLVTNSTAYLLPIAECDLNMNLNEKGLLNAMPYFGMFLSTLITGFLTDTFGRIMFLKIGFGGIFIFTVLAATSQNYAMLATAKFLEGILFTASVAGISSLTSEFCHSSVRDRIMLSHSSNAAIAQVLLPAMAWGILIQDWKSSFFEGKIVLNTWNYYLLIMSLWSLTACILYSFLPESPKFLVTQKRYIEARTILIRIYVENTRKPADTFPFPNLFEKKIKEENPKATEIDAKSFKDKITTGLKNMKPLFGRPLLGYLILIGSVQFITIGIHNVVRLWFPQLSTIVEHYKLEGHQDLCALLDTYTGDLKLRSVSNRTAEVCVPDTADENLHPNPEREPFQMIQIVHYSPTIDHAERQHVSGSETYINSIIIGTVCILPYFISGVFVNKVGKKVLLLLGGAICIASLLGLRWSNSKIMMVSFFALNVAMTQIMKSLSQVVLIDVIPTAMRTFALSVVMLVARMGTLVGNVSFPLLLALECRIPFYTMAGLMACVLALTIFLPKKKE